MDRFELLSGEHVYLRPLLESDSKGCYPDWLNDAEVSRGNSHHTFPYTASDAVQYIRAVSAARDALVLAVVARQGDRHVGNVALQHIRPIDRTAEFAILFGEREAWGRGYGTEAARLICAYGFTTLGLHRIGCGTFEHNEAMRKLALSLGMHEEGRRREAAFKDGRYVDIIEYGVLRDEFFARFRELARAVGRPRSVASTVDLPRT